MVSTTLLRGDVFIYLTWALLLINFRLFSMITIRPFKTARESVLPIWLQAAQARRSAPNAQASELFVLLHRMLFMNIQLDFSHF